MYVRIHTICNVSLERHIMIGPLPSVESKINKIGRENIYVRRFLYSEQTHKCLFQNFSSRVKNVNKAKQGRKKVKENDKNVIYALLLASIYIKLVQA